MSEIFEVECPTCAKKVEWSAKSEFRPFCSKRCQLIDLGAWAAEKHKIPTETADFAMELSEDNQDWVKH